MEYELKTLITALDYYSFIVDNAENGEAEIKAGIMEALGIDKDREFPFICKSDKPNLKKFLNDCLEQLDKEEGVKEI